MQSLLNQTYAWARKWPVSSYGPLVIFLFLFIDASIFPLPTTVIFITISLIHPSKSYINALTASLAMVLGATAGYAIGHFLWLHPDGSFTPFATYMFDHIPNFSEINYQYAQNLYNQWKYMILLFSTILPIPYELFSITAGAFNFNLAAFIFSTFVFQGLRFFLFAWLIIRYGEGAKTIFKENLKIISIVTAFILLIIIIVTKIGWL